MKFPREYKQEIRKFETSDYGNAEVLNQPLNILVNNDVYIKEQLEAIQQGFQTHMETTAEHVTEAQKDAWANKAEKTTATDSANGLMSATDKGKLDGIAVGAEINQNAFQTVRAGGIDVQANEKTAQMEFVAENNVTIIGDNGTKKITIYGPNAVKNPAALTVQMNGVTSASYDGSAAKTVNITPAGIGAALVSHIHDDRYYTETEINTKLNSKANSSHTHTVAQVSGLPTTLPANGGNADTIDGAHGYQMQTLNVDGGSHGTAHMVVCQYNVNRDNRFFFRKEGNDYEISVHHALYANSAGSVAWGNVSGKPSTFPPTSHTHDDRYYTEAEINTKLNGKANSSHTHAASQISGLPSTLPANGGTAARIFNGANTNDTAMQFNWNGQNGQPNWLWGGNDGTNMYVYNPAAFSVDYANRAGSANSVTWGNVSGKPSTFSPTSHTHDDRYYTEAEINTKLNSKANSNAPVFTNSISMGRKAGTVIGANSVATGESVEASGKNARAYGWLTVASGSDSHAEGNGTRAEGSGSHAEGLNTRAEGCHSHAEGSNTRAVGHESHAEGSSIIAKQSCSTVIGEGNIEEGEISGSNPNSIMFIIGGGFFSERSNAFKVSKGGKVYTKSGGSYNASGADYGEFFEWIDKNPETEDRVGYFVALDGDKIKVAKAGDYVLGAVSGTAGVIGNSDEHYAHRWKTDEFGRLLTQKKIFTDEITGEEYITDVNIENENYAYKQDLEYTHRADRPEWDVVGMLGVLAVQDDGTCQVNGYCQVANGGIATAAAGTGEYALMDGQLVKRYRVIERITDNIIKIIFR